LINNAGIMPIGPFLAEPDDVARRQFDINVHGVILGMKIALPRMLVRGDGQIVNLASAAGRLASLPGEATNVATKHAVVGLSEAVRCELEGTGVTVTTVLPNIADTRLGSGMHAARGMKKLDAKQIADAIVDGLRDRRAEVYVPRSLRQLSVLDLALPRGPRRLVHRAFGTDGIAQDGEVVLLAGSQASSAGGASAVVVRTPLPPHGRHCAALVLAVQAAEPGLAATTSSRASLSGQRAQTPTAYGYGYSCQARARATP
jgi:hypothetical protein